MGKQRFLFNTVSQRYEVYKPGRGIRILRCGLLAVLIAVVTFGIRNSLGQYINNPKEIKLLSEKEEIIDQYLKTEKKIDALEACILEFQYRDDNLYRSYYEMEAIPFSLREAGLGGVERYSNLKGYENSQLMLDLTRRVDMADVKLNIQANSFRALLFEAEDHKQLINHKPSIQPISLEDFYWVSSLYGYRTDPISKRRTMHQGIDFAGRIGLNVYATGDGVVIRTKVSRGGFGKEVLIDHGFGYVTRYGHMKDISVQVGQEVKRGAVVGLLGSTGRSTGPHLHYEVREFGVAKNPKNFFSDDLTPTEYAAIVKLPESVNN